MTNKYFPEEQIEINDLYFVCYMIERVSRRLHQKNSYVVNAIGRGELVHLLSVANVLHSLNPLQVEDDWIKDYELEKGTYDVTKVDHELVEQIPSAIQMAKVYVRLILNTAAKDEEYVDGILRVYNDSICEVLDNYNCSAYYEPSYVIAKAYYAGGF